MTRITLWNPETGEERVIVGQGTFQRPWRVKSIYHEPRREDLRLAMWAERKGIPVDKFLDAARWLLRKECPFCQLGTKVLQAIDALGEERTGEILDAIIAAKDANDLTRLEEIKRSIWASDQPG